MQQCECEFVRFIECVCVCVFYSAEFSLSFRIDWISREICSQWAIFFCSWSMCRWERILGGQAYATPTFLFFIYKFHRIDLNNYNVWKLEKMFTFRLNRQCMPVSQSDTEMQKMQIYLTDCSDIGIQCSQFHSNENHLFKFLNCFPSTFGIAFSRDFKIIISKQRYSNFVVSSILWRQ